MRVFVAGASGVIGRRLVPQLVERGHEVVATARTPEKGETLRALGAEAVVMDGLDAASVGEAVARAEPEVVVHQMTALAGVSRSATVRRGVRAHERAANARHRPPARGGRRRRRPPVRRPELHRLAERAGRRPGQDGETIRSTRTRPRSSGGRSRRSGYLERAVTSAAPIEGVVLRYGSLYGPGTSMANEYARADPGAEAPARRRRRGRLVVHPRRRRRLGDRRSRSSAERRALYNVVDDEPAPVAEWLPYLAECLGARPPRHVPAWLARFAIGEVGVSMMTADPRRLEREGEARARLGARRGGAGARGSRTGSSTGRCVRPPRRAGMMLDDRVEPEGRTWPRRYEDLRPLLFSISYRMLGSVARGRGHRPGDVPALPPRAARAEAPRSSRRRRTCPR